MIVRPLRSLTEIVSSVPWLLGDTPPYLDINQLYDTVDILACEGISLNARLRMCLQYAFIDNGTVRQLTLAVMQWLQTHAGTTQVTAHILAAAAKFADDLLSDALIRDIRNECVKLAARTDVNTASVHYAILSLQSGFAQSAIVGASHALWCLQLAMPDWEASSAFAVTTLLSLLNERTVAAERYTPLHHRPRLAVRNYDKAEGV